MTVRLRLAQCDTQESEGERRTARLSLAQDHMHDRERRG
jgi:hypothetical protein